jgi:hypothetical protein
MMPRRFRLRTLAALCSCHGGIYGGGSVQTANLANGSVTRLKLADNAPVSKAANYNIVGNDKYAQFVATAALAFNLPAANSVNAGFRVDLKSQTEQSVTIARAGADTLDNQNVVTYQLPSFCGVTVQSDGVSDWKFLNRPDIDVGKMVDFGGGTLPLGYVAPDGSNRNRVTYGGLFAAYSTTWGVGDGVNTFGTPDSRRRARVGSGGVGTGVLGNAVGNVGGEETHILSLAEIAPHSHLQSPNTVLQVVGGTYAGGGTGGTGGFTDTQGGGAAHNIIQPTMVCTVGIKT